MTTNAPTDRARRRCPHCGAAAARPFRPFCSRRCRDLDLARWLDGAYAIPLVEEDGAEEEGVSSRESDR